MTPRPAPGAKARTCPVGAASRGPFPPVELNGACSVQTEGLLRLVDAFVVVVHSFIVLIC